MSAYFNAHICNDCLPIVAYCFIYLFKAVYLTNACLLQFVYFALDVCIVIIYANAFSSHALSFGYCLFQSFCIMYTAFNQLDFLLFDVHIAFIYERATFSLERYNSLLLFYEK